MNLSLLQRMKAKVPEHISKQAASYEDVLQWRKDAEAQQKIDFKRKATLWLINHSGMSERFKSCSFENYVVGNEDQGKALAYAKRYADTFTEQLKLGKGFMFVGNPGTGKNHLASAIANQLFTSNHSVLIVTVSDLIKMIRDTWSKSSQVTEQQIMNKLTKVDLLIIDEIGLQKGSEDEQLHLTKIIDKRLYSFKPTSIISNCANSSDIKKYIGFRTYDRLKEGNLFGVVFDWESYRGKAS
jgi:DNA replication protein DnaC